MEYGSSLDVDAGGQEHPSISLQRKARQWGLDVLSMEMASRLDREDPLREFRQKFHYPLMKHLPETSPDLIEPDKECVYLCGNSLGLEPKGARLTVERELDKWSKMGVFGHTYGEMPWAEADECVDGDMADLVGADRSEVAVMNGLTVNQHLLLISFYRPSPGRHKILMEKHSFPSDHYTVESQIRLHGYDPKTSMLFLEPRKGENTIRPEDIEKILEERGSEVAVVMLPGVQYYTGQVFDMKNITNSAHKQGCYVGFDLAHAVGNVEIELHDWGVDFACWCTYKYVNSGAGCIAGAFVHSVHKNNQFPKLHGWWSHNHSTRFDMTNELDVAPGASGYRISNPPPLLCCTLEASLQVFKQTTMKELRKKSVLLTGYLEFLLSTYFPERPDGSPGEQPFVRIITPSDPEQRGCQLSVMFSVPISKVFTELKKRAVVLDKREPNVLRLAPTPLYNSFVDVYRFIKCLQESILAAR